MRNNLMEIYDILSTVDKLSLNNYEQLCVRYGKETVDEIINRFILEDEEYIYVFEDCYLDESLDNIKDLEIYDIYIADIRMVECLDSDGNMKLLKIAYDLIKKMEEIFNLIGSDDSKLVDNKVPWIADKVEYCMKNCDDLDTLDKLNTLYKEYLDVRDRIVVGNLRLVVKLANEYCDDKLLLNDMIQSGNVGLIRAIEKFDINKGVTFNTYAGYWIKQRMIRDMKNIKYPMRVPMNIIYKNASMLEARNALSIQLGRSITYCELARLIDIDLSTIRDMLVYFGNTVSLDEILLSDYDEKEYTREELIPDENVDVFQEAINLYYRQDLLDFLSTYLKEKEFLVLKNCFFEDDDSLTEKEFGKLLGLGQQGVSNTKKRALQKLRKKSKIRDIVIV